MKQRLLLALLVLFAAAGMVKAVDEVKVKSNQSNEVKITFSEAVSSTFTQTGVTLSDDKKTVTIKPSAGNGVISISWSPTGSSPSIAVGGNINTLEISDNNVKSLSFSNGCHIDELTVNSTSLTTLNCSKLGLTKLTLTESRALEDINASQNQLANDKLIGLDACKNALKKLNISNNAFATFDPSSLAVLTDLDVSHNKLSTISVSALTALARLNISDNHIVTVTAGDKCSVTYGTQDIELPNTGSEKYNEQPANIGYDIKQIIDKVLGDLDCKTYSFKSWKVKTTGDEYVADSPQTAHAMPSPYSDEYRFYDKDGVYVDGTYQLSVTVDGRDFNIYNVIVKPAKFKLTWDTPANAKDPATGKTNPVINVAGRDATLTNGGEVYQGEVLTINTDPKDGYDRIVYTLVSGLVPTGTGEAIDEDHPNSYAQNPFTCKVEGKFKDRATSIEPKFTTEVAGTQHFVTFVEADKTKGGIFTVQKGHGSQTTSLAPNAKNEIGTGDQLIVKLLPNPSYEGTLYINNKKIETTGDNPINKNNVYTYTVKDTDKDFNISVTFEKKEVKLECRIDGIELKGTNLTTDLAYIKDQKITIDGGVDNGGTVIPKGTNGDDEVFVAKNTDHQFSFTINQTTGHEHCILDVINISGGELKRISDPIKETTGSPSTTTVAYNVSFSVKEADVTISIKTKELQEVKVNVVKNYKKASGVSEPDAQKQVYDGNPKPILFTTTPAGLEKLISVKYATPAPSSSQLGTTAPSLPGEYTATLTFEDKEGNYVLSNETSLEDEETLIIAKAKLTIETLPTVTLGNDGKYVIGKEGKVKFGSTEVKGEFKAIKENGDPKNQPEGNTEIGKTHTVTLQFTPTSDSDKALYEYPTGSVIVKGYADVDPVKVAIWSPLPTGITLKLYNGDKLVDVSKDEFLPGTGLTAVVTYPAGMKNVEPVVTSGNTGTTIATSGVTPELSADGKTYSASYPVTLGEGLKDGKIEFNVKADAAATYTVKFDKQTFKYDGQMHEFDKDKIHVYGANNQEITNDVNNKLTVTYKDKNGTAVPLPRDAGSYTVCIRIEATEGYGLYEKDFADQLVIEAIPATVYAWPVASMISKGFPVSMSMLTGGAYDVPGTFSWHPEDAVKKPQKIEGEEDKDKNRFRVVFTPESKNYSAVTTPFGTGQEDKRVEVQVSDLQIVTFGQEEIKVVNKAGVVLQPGSPIIKGDELTITVEPKEGFELESLTVNGSTNSGKYTVGDESVAIVAAFKVKKADPTDVVLTFPTETSCLGKGYRLSVYGAKGLSFNTEYKFTVSTLAADKSKLVVTAGGQTVQANADGSYTVKADASKTITVSLPTPTKLKVSVERVTKNDKGNIMGKVEVEGLSTTDNTCYYGDQVTIVAFPESGVTFGGWNGITSTDKLATFTVKEPMTIKPKFSGVPTGIETIEGMRIYGREGHIFIGCDGEAKVTLISMDGRVKKVEISGDSRIETAAGVYGVIVEKGSEVLKEKVIVK